MAIPTDFALQHRITISPEAMMFLGAIVVAFFLRSGKRKK